ncbi:MAG TPA: outer membrane lipoprotein carrier protein LolA [Pseudolabrys sp.]|nr:outer membrane lipoprotein carrier protein LolA [Pseudolabrys sp.]
MADFFGARGRRMAAMAAVVAGLTAPPAFAQSVPLPRPNPHRGLITGSVREAVPAAAMRARAQAQPAQAQPAQAAPNPISNPFAALLGKPGSTQALNPQQRAIIDKVNNYLSSVTSLTGKFVQIGPDGSRSTGIFYLAKPGRVRFEYDSPSPIELIADGQSVVVRDRNLATQDVYPLSQTPLRFLLADHVDLMKDTNLVAVYADDVFVTVVVEEKNTLVGTSRLMIMFDAKDMQLKQWTVTDPQGYDTTVAVYNLDASKKPDLSMFRIDYTRYHN